MTDLLPQPEFSRLVKSAEIPHKGLQFDIEATPNECQKLAQRFGLIAIEALSAHIRLFPAKDLIRLEGRLKARVVQSCVVTLDPVDQAIDEDFSRVYGDDEALEAARLAMEAEIEIDPLADDLPDPLIDGCIDVGEAAAEELALNLDPFPRKPGASLEGSPWAAKEEAIRGPFAALSKLRDKFDKKV
ncbi:MAG: DUF177 domain-containing protein [Alphaproteobacteria bacterium]|nr:DUF177 domain-containing protein [Alphaproteobacteria bacterium]